MENDKTYLYLGLFSGLVIAALLAVILFSPFTVIGAGNRGVVTNFGKVKEEVLTEGFHWVSPMAAVIEMSVQTQRFEATASAASKDLQSVTAQIVVNGHIDPTAVNKLYQSIGSDYEAKIIDPAIQESVKAATAQFTAEELITKRAEVGSLIQTSLAERLQKNYISVESVSIVDFQFSPSFNAAIEAKVTAEQDALAAKNRLEQIKYEGEQTVVKANAEAESIRIQAESIAQQGGEAYVKLKWIEKWNGALPATMLNDAASLFLGL